MWQGIFNMGQCKTRTRTVSEMMQEVDADDEAYNQGVYFRIPALCWVPVAFLLVCTGLASFFKFCAAHYPPGGTPVIGLMPPNL
jgi:hypothetical protein